MEIEFRKKWDELLRKMAERFKMEMDLKSMLFVIGLQELGMKTDKLSKDQKLDVMHIAVCSLLEPYGHYKYIGRDKDGWPHWEVVDKLPFLNGEEQELLIRKCIVEYWEKYN